MLKDIRDLQLYMCRSRNEIAAIRERRLLCSPGCSEAECARLDEVLPGLPGSYVRCIRAFDLRLFEIGYFLMRPRFGKGGIVEKLILTNTSESNPMLPFLRSYGLYEVAAWEADPVCVATDKSPFADGAVLWVTLPEPRSQISPLASNFELFMIIAGNLDLVRDRNSRAIDNSAAHVEFREALRGLNVSGNEAIAWGKIAEVVL